MTAYLLDTGPLIALIDRSEPEHASVCNFMEGLRGSVITTGAVVTEALHFLSDVADGPGNLVAFLAASGIVIYDVFDVETLEYAARLMKKYADAPMDFADATLVWVAGETGTGNVITLDRRGFSTFRSANNRRFKLLLDL